MKTKFKGYELVTGDVVDIDGVIYIVKDMITTKAIGYMQRLNGIEIPYDQWWMNLLVKWHFKQPKLWYDKITLYYNTTYRVLGSSYVN